jgi:hypothetical protein
MAALFSSSVLPRVRRVLGRVLRCHTPDAQIVGQVVALDALGWRVTEIRPSLIDGEVSLWRVTAERIDLDASMCTTAADPAGALAEIVRYASADAAGGR